MKNRGAIVQTAIDLVAAAKEIDELLGQERKGAAAVEAANKIVTSWRYRVGQLFEQVRKTFPERGPRAKGWGEFVRARGLSLDSALRYVEIAKQVTAQPELAQSGSWMDLYRVMGLSPEPPTRDLPQPAVNVTPRHDSLGASNNAAPQHLPARPPKQGKLAASYEEREIMGQLTAAEGLERATRLAKEGPGRSTEEAERLDALRAERERARPASPPPKAPKPKAEAPDPWDGPLTDSFRQGDLVIFAGGNGPCFVAGALGMALYLRDFDRPSREPIQMKVRSHREGHAETTSAGRLIRVSVEEGRRLGALPEGEREPAIRKVATESEDQAFRETLFPEDNDEKYWQSRAQVAEARLDKITATCAEIARRLGLMNEDEPPPAEDLLAAIQEQVTK